MSMFPGHYFSITFWRVGKTSFWCTPSLPNKPFPASLAAREREKVMAKY
ncbi:hypothetical protein [Mixta theicola]|nr:hypothetical protein [Mixta theicola]